MCVCVRERERERERDREREREREKERQTDRQTDRQRQRDRDRDRDRETERQRDRQRESTSDYNALVHGCFRRWSVTDLSYTSLFGEPETTEQTLTFANRRKPSGHVTVVQRFDPKHCSESSTLVVTH